MPIGDVAVGDLVRVRPGERMAVDGDGGGGRSTRGRVDADRREPAGREGAGRRRGRRDGEPHRRLLLPGHPRGRGHRARAHRPARRGGAGLQGAHPAPGRPRGRRVRARRARHRRAHLRGVVAVRARARRLPCADQRSGRARHRLPLRHGPGHAHRDHGRDRARGRARHPDPQRRGPRGAPRAEVVVLDKTGTLTVGRPRGHRRRAASEAPGAADELLALAAAAEQGSEHPLGEAIVGRGQGARARAAAGERVSGRPRPGRGRAAPRGPHPARQSPAS